MITTERNRFNGGMTNDPRDPNTNMFRVVSNFDVLTRPGKMTPYRSSESGDTDAATNKIKNYQIALRTGTTYSLYGLAQTSSKAKILYKDLTTGSANDLDDSAWTNTANNTSASGATNFNLFIYYKKTGLVYGARAGSHIWAYDPAGSIAFGDTERALSYTNITQGLVHSKDDILYVGYDNKLAKNDNGSWTDAALTFPSHFVITSLSEYGNYLAIACAPLSGIGNSRVYLWDRDATLTTLAESVDWGVGSLMILEEVDGFLVGISQRGGSASSITGNPAGTISFGDRVIFQYLNGTRAEKFMEMQGGSNTTKLAITKQKVNSRLYFSMLISFNGAVRDGVFSIGRSSPSSPFALIHERTSNNNTALATSDSIFSFFAVGDYLFISYSTTAGSVVAMSKTLATATYSHNSVAETVRFNAGDSSLKKDMHGITIKHEYLPSGASVIVKYRVDQNASWTTMLSSTTADAISASAVAQEGLPKDYKELELQMLSTGGAEITGYSFKEEITGKRSYE